ncbi:unnamed protein product [Penicillium bialowiezense]
MVSSTINFSGLLCLVLALGPATVLSAPHMPGSPAPDLWNSPESTNEDGNSDFTAGSGFNSGIPDGPQFNAGSGVHTSHRGPCGPGSGDDSAAGSGFSAGIPGGPQFNAGAGYADHHDGYPCEEPPAAILPPAPTGNNVPVYTPAPAPQAPVAEAPAPVAPDAQAPAAQAPAPMAPTYTTPIYIPHATPAVWSPAVPIMKPSAPLIPHPAPAPSSSPSPSAMPAFNAGSSLAPASVLAIALPVILAFFN